MIKKTTDFIEKGRLPGADNFRGRPAGQFVLKSPYGSYLFVIACDADPMEWLQDIGPGQTFDHVSVSVNTSGLPHKRTPTWEEMNWVKDIFFEPEELVIQYHPPKSQYVNNHEHVLHLWKIVGFEIPLPPKQCV